MDYAASLGAEMIGYARLEIVRSNIEIGTIGRSAMWLELPPLIRIGPFLFFIFCSEAE